MPALLDDEEVRGLDALPPDALYEVIDGEAKEIAPMGFVANLLAFRFGVALSRFMRSPQDVLVVEGLFALPAPVNRRRRPDFAYVPAERVPANWPPPNQDDPPAMPAVPSLVVEVVSPTDLLVELEEKRKEYFAVGVTTVVFIYPTHRTVHVHDSVSRCRVLTDLDMLDVGEALPGTSIRIADLFAPLTPQSPPQ